MKRMRLGSLMLATMLFITPIYSASTNTYSKKITELKNSGLLVNYLVKDLNNDGIQDLYFLTYDGDKSSGYMTHNVVTYKNNQEITLNKKYELTAYLDSVYVVSNKSGNKHLIKSVDRNCDEGYELIVGYYEMTSSGLEVYLSKSVQNGKDEYRKRGEVISKKEYDNLLVSYSSGTLIASKKGDTIQAVESISNVTTNQLYEDQINALKKNTTEILYSINDFNEDGIDDIYMITFDEIDSTITSESEVLALCINNELKKMSTNTQRLPYRDYLKQVYILSDKNDKNSIVKKVYQDGGTGGYDKTVIYKKMVDGKFVDYLKKEEMLQVIRVWNEKTKEEDKVETRECTYYKLGKKITEIEYNNIIANYNNSTQIYDYYKNLAQ